MVTLLILLQGMKTEWNNCFMGWFIWMSYLTKHSITWHLQVYETRVSECVGYCPLHPQIFLLCSVSQQTGLYVLLHSFLFCFFFASISPSANRRYQQEIRKWEEKRGWCVFPAPVAILAVTISLPLQTLLEASVRAKFQLSLSSRKNTTSTCPSGPVVASHYCQSQSMSASPCWVL